MLLCFGLKDADSAPSPLYCLYVIAPSLLAMDMDAKPSYAQTQTYSSPQGPAKHSPADDQDNWSGEASSDDNRSLKRKRPLSVSCETCKARKVCVLVSRFSKIGRAHV